MTDMPIVCRLSDADLARRGDALLPGLARRADKREETADGYRLRFAPDDGLLRIIADVVDAERQCCRFLRFALVVEPNLGPVWLTLSGPPGTVDMLMSLLS
jgi:hypothetical protein